MGKRHVFWRTPTGKPYRRDDGEQVPTGTSYNGDDGKHAPTALLANIGQAASVSAEGNIAFPFDSIYFKDRLAVQTAAVVLDPHGDELNDTDTSSIIWKAVESEIKRQGGGRPLSPKAVLSCADRLAAFHFRKAVIEYVLITTLSVQQLPAKSIKVNDCTISSIAARGARYPLPVALKSLGGHCFHAKHLSSTKYLTIKVRTNGRSVSEATGKALHAITLLRGLWTLFATLGSWKIQLAGVPKREPIGVIRTGPIHTLHDLDGKPAVDAYWYRPDFTEDGRIFMPKRGWSNIEYNRRWAMRRMRRYAYKRDLEELIVRYANALDNVDLTVAFLQMWGILEKITDTVGKNYDETIRRTTWRFPERDTAKELLEHLRFRRNQYVHAAKSGDKPDQAAYLVKAFVEPHLIELIRNDFRVASLSEYADFLRLPTSIDTLKKRRAQLDRALRFREHDTE